MKSRKVIIALLIIFILISTSILVIKVNNNSNLPLSNVKRAAGGIYVLSTPRKIVYLSNDFKEISETEILGGWEIQPITAEKVYVSIRGNPNKNGQEILVLENGKITDKIKLTYNMPTIIRYNDYNKKAYIGHVGKISNNDENCIIVIDTLTDKEEKNIMYDSCVEDITFDQDGKMFVRAWDTTGGNDRIDVFDLSTDSIIKSIPLDAKITSFVYSESTDLIYGVTELDKEPILYIIDWQKGEIIDKVTLKFRNPYKIKLFDYNGEEHLFISHFNIDDGKGQEISIIDPITKKTVNYISDATYPRDFFVSNNQIITCSTNNNKLLVYDNLGDKIKSIDVQYPISIVKVGE